MTHTYDEANALEAQSLITKKIGPAISEIAQSLTPKSANDTTKKTLNEHAERFNERRG